VAILLPELTRALVQLTPQAKMIVAIMQVRLLLRCALAIRIISERDFSFE
jgi:hypothetical protein